jgi:hypothetical protein
MGVERREVRHVVTGVMSDDEGKENVWGYDE